MKLNNSEESNLILTISDILNETKIARSGRVIFEKNDELRTEVKNKLGADLDSRITEICGESGLLDFIRFHLMREAVGLVNVRRPVLINTIDQYKDSINTARRLVSVISKLPQKLRVISPLPRSLSCVMFHGHDNLKIADGVHIASSEWIFNNTNLTIENEILRQLILSNTNISSMPKKFGHYLVTWHSGFAGDFTGSQSVQEHMDKLRALQGAFLATDVMMEDFFFESLPHHPILVSDISDVSEGNLVIADNVDSDVSHYYRTFDVALPFYTEVPSEESEDEEYDYILDEDEITARDEIISYLQIIFGDKDSHRRLFTSCLWMFRAYASTRPVDTLLESTIAIEVLLGDRDSSEGLGLTNLLANRCAFLLGSSADERTNLIGEFKKLYEIRSNIVHRGLHHSDKKVAGASLAARKLALRILKKELRLGL